MMDDDVKKAVDKTIHTIFYIFLIHISISYISYIYLALLILFTSFYERGIWHLSQHCPGVKLCSRSYQAYKSKRNCLPSVEIMRLSQVSLTLETKLAPLEDMEMSFTIFPLPLFYVGEFPPSSQYFKGSPNHHLHIYRQPMLSKCRFSF